jgi:hypothetical protein
VNDNVFLLLFENPGRTFSIDELSEIVGKRDPRDLHKIVANLNFVGPLKKVFFRVSKNAISFTPTASLGQLATLGIDPKAI